MLLIWLRILLYPLPYRNLWPSLGVAIFISL